MAASENNYMILATIRATSSGYKRFLIVNTLNHHMQINRKKMCCKQKLC